MPITPPPQRTAEEIRSQQPSIGSKLMRMTISFLLGVLAFLVLLVVSGNKTVGEVVEMVTGLF
ncbi:MAG: hypothetical protein IJD04_00945 [Desulfovibrionaceae bacterium]|nr:hypothetical protein [Desulfovibrionaceae bacterium]